VRPPLRVLSLPCAAGEEPYSIAMALRDLGLPVRRFCIDAVDISAHRLEIARRGVYSANAFRGSDLSYRARYFHEHPRGFELDSAIRSTVRFVQASVLDTGLLDGSPRYDVVFCRNLLIYLGADARVRVLAAIERLLKADGLLFIGHADRLAIAGVELKFSPAGDPACFGYRFAIGVAGAPAAPKIEPPWRVSVSPSKTAPPGYAAPIPVAVLPDSPALIAASTRADRVVHPTASCSGGDEPPLLDQAALLANQGRFDEAVVACECHLRIKGMSSPAYYLMGMIYQAAGNRTRAEDCFHKTVYLDPIHDEALLALALLAERRGDLDAAQGFRRRAERSATMSRKRVN
jgi:chemotaxis protein methyltransferase WspC